MTRCSVDLRPTRHNGRPGQSLVKAIGTIQRGLPSIRARLAGRRPRLTCSPAVELTPGVGKCQVQGRLARGSVASRFALKRFRHGLRVRPAAILHMLSIGTPRDIDGATLSGVSLLFCVRTANRSSRPVTSRYGGSHVQRGMTIGNGSSGPGGHRPFEVSRRLSVKARHDAGPDVSCHDPR